MLSKADRTRQRWVSEAGHTIGGISSKPVTAEVDDVWQRVDSFREQLLASASRPIAPESQIDQIWVPDVVATDFEKGLINAFGSLGFVFGCYFHFVQSLIRKVGELHLRKEYKLNRNFRMKVVELTLIAFLPLQDVEVASQRVLTEILRTTDTENALRLVTFGAYFRRTWLRRFPPSTWNVFLRINRTSNLVERNNKELKNVLFSRMTFEQYMAALVKFDCSATTDYERFLFHRELSFPATVKTKDQAKERKLWEVMKRYADSPYSTKRYLDELHLIYAKRLKDKVQAFEILQSYPENQTSADPLPSLARLVSDCFAFKAMRCCIQNDKLSVKAHKHLLNDAVWNEVTKRKRAKKYVGNNHLVKPNQTHSLLNCIVLIKCKEWRFAMMAMLEQDTAFIFLNEEHRYEIVDDLLQSVQKKHVRFA